RVHEPAAGHRSHAEPRAARACGIADAALRETLPVAVSGEMNDSSSLDETVKQVESPAAGYAGRPRDPQLEYKAILGNVSIGIAFTRDRKFTLCNPKFAEMFGWNAEELIGQPGEVVYPSRESYEAMGAIAVPLLSAGRQLDVEWEVRRKDGSTF